jgi:hypothetical protein
MADGLGPVFPTVPVTVLEAALQGRATVETIGRVLGGAIVAPIDESASVAVAMATLSAGLDEFGFGAASCTCSGDLFIVQLAGPTFHLAALAESFVSAVIGAATGREIGALAFDDGDGGYAVGVVDPGVAAFLRAKHVTSLAHAERLLQRPEAS